MHAHTQQSHLYNIIEHYLRYKKEKQKKKQRNRAKKGITKHTHTNKTTRTCVPSTELQLTALMLYFLNSLEVLISEEAHFMANMWTLLEEVPGNSLSGNHSRDRVPVAHGLTNSDYIWLYSCGGKCTHTRTHTHAHMHAHTHTHAHTMCIYIDCQYAKWGMPHSECTAQISAYICTIKIMRNLCTI